MRRIAAVLAVSLALVLGLGSLPASADDSGGALADGGATITTTDGGSTAVFQLRNGANWTMATRPEGAQSTRYVLCATSSCAATSESQLLDYDVTQDIPVNTLPLPGAAKQYMAVRTDDGGVPLVRVHVSR